MLTPHLPSRGSQHSKFAFPANNPDAPGGVSISSTLQNNQREIRFALKWVFCMRLIKFTVVASTTLIFLLGGTRFPAQSPGERNPLPLPSGKVIYDPVPGKPMPTNSFPGTVILSPDGRYLAILNDGWGTPQSSNTSVKCYNNNKRIPA